MPITILDFDDAYEQNKALLSEVVQEFGKEFYAPVVDAQLSQVWKSLPDELKLQLRQTDKATVDKMEKLFNGGA